MTENESDDEQTCPICGQPYEHKLTHGEIRQSDFRERPAFREDVSVCETAVSGGITTAYVHHERNAVVKSVAKREPPEEPGFFGDFFD